MMKLHVPLQQSPAYEHCDDAGRHALVHAPDAHLPVEPQQSASVAQPLPARLQHVPYPGSTV